MYLVVFDHEVVLAGGEVDGAVGKERVEVVDYGLLGEVLV